MRRLLEGDVDVNYRLGLGDDLLVAVINPCREEPLEASPGLIEAPSDVGGLLVVGEAQVGELIARVGEEVKERVA